MGLFEQINAESKSRQLDFLVIGGLAVNLYGFVRDTADLDLLVLWESRGQWQELLIGFGYTIVAERPAFCQFAPPSQGSWPVDLMFVRLPSFKEFLRLSREAEMFGERLRFPALEHLLALKLHALKHSHAGRFLKDYLDVEGLVRANRIDLRQERMRELFLRYGTLDTYEKLVRSCARD